MNKKDSIILEVFAGKNRPSISLSFAPTLYPIGYRYDRRWENFIVVWSPQGGRRQEISCLPRVFFKILPELECGISANFTAGSTEVTHAKLEHLGFVVNYGMEVATNVHTSRIILSA